MSQSVEVPLLVEVHGTVQRGEQWNMQSVIQSSRTYAHAEHENYQKLVGFSALSRRQFLATRPSCSAVGFHSRRLKIVGKAAKGRENASVPRETGVDQLIKEGRKRGID
ncbi:hypothetical protein R1flu_011417 [Riccia fluitans]|uniref:Uncharacterized protein n=1 Tax=Riccia fluitans TaxID=41844 RepID=A0ABD1Z7R8_9MARC